MASTHATQPSASTTLNVSSLILREYQSEANAKVRWAERLNPKARVCVQGPTGSGKTPCIADLLLDPFPQVMVTDRRILCEQTSQFLHAYGVAHGVRAAGYAATRTAPIQIVMLQTDYIRKLPPIAGCRRIIIDEIHKVNGPMAQSLIKKYGANASVVGFTATPSEISHVVDDVIVMATVKELVAQGHLVPHTVYGPLVPDMEALAKLRRQVNGDYSALELDKVIPIRAIFGRMVDNWRLYNPLELPTILFAVGVPQSLWAAQHLTSNGIPSVHVDCKNIWINGEFLETNQENLELVRYAMEKGDIKIVCNRYLLREGVNWPFLKVAVLATAFGTRKSHVQAVGRIFRPYQGADEAIVIDHGGNWLTHPMLDSDFPWDFRTKGTVLASEYLDSMRADEDDPDSIPEPICCPKCMAIRVSGNQCPRCGFQSLQRSRWVFQANGLLKQVYGKAFKQRRITEKPGQAEEWKGRFIGNRKYHPERTCNQIYANMAREDNWKFPPRDLPGMPRTKRGWYIPVGELSADDLINGKDILK